jgi:predicted metal-binding protein/ubiquinone/menaquinone biosynthesis C-methylase UbiE
MKPVHQNADIALETYQRLEDLATAYWYSEVLFASLELNIFGLLAQSPATAGILAGKTGYDPDGLLRLLEVLAALGLVVEEQGEFSNGPLASNRLVPQGPGYLGDFLLYRRYFAPQWQRLAARVKDGARANERCENESPEQYQKRTFSYVRALDLQAGLKAAEALAPLKVFIGSAPELILDAGCGAGAWARAFLAQWPASRAVVFDLPETLRAARMLYPGPEKWDRTLAVAGSLFEPCIGAGSFDLIVISNVVHAYGRAEAAQILANLCAWLAPGGTLVVHDYLTDLHDSDPVKGALYDLHMLINTYNGRVYKLEEMLDLLKAAGFESVRFFHLKTDTTIFVAKAEPAGQYGEAGPREMLASLALGEGFSFARLIETADISIEPWVRLKCRFGCALYGQSLCCPPESLDEDKMRDLVSGYRYALLVQGSPPSGQFHENLLALERSLFLQGHYDALAFGAGPCPVCPSCPQDRRCRFPKKARPSLEACGVDVYETARRAGLSLNPVTHRQGYVKYVGLVLFDRKERHADSTRPGSLDA